MDMVDGALRASSTKSNTSTAQKNGCRPTFSRMARRGPRRPAYKPRFPPAKPPSRRGVPPRPSRCCGRGETARGEHPVDFASPSF